MPPAELKITEDVQLAPLTTLGVGGRAQWFVSAGNAEEIVAARKWASERGVDVFVLGGGSNLVVSDSGIGGLVLQVDIRGCTRSAAGDRLHVAAGAGEVWDTVVATAVDSGFSGLECLSGIPGRVGGTPIQNVGAYGQEVADAIETVTAVDRTSGAVVTLPGSACGFSYRQSRFKGADAGRFIVTAVSYVLSARAPTVTYPDVVTYLAERRTQTPAVADVRRAVLEIRRRKGMVLDAGDLDTRSAGSFFMNPVLSASEYERVAAAPAAAGTRVPSFAPPLPTPSGDVKVPAAWLIERAGFSKGHAAGAVGLSSKHPLAIVNRGGATARDVVTLAAAIKRRVIDAFGVWLRIEPVCAGFGADDTVAFLEQTRS